MSDAAPERRIKLTIAYDGTDFKGWQIQKKDRTVQQVLESALAKIHKHPVRLCGSGRTDSGVHAFGQIAHYDSDLSQLPDNRILLALNSILPYDVRVLNAETVHNNFHARFDAVTREYRYYIREAAYRLPTQERYTWYLPELPDSTVLNSYAAKLPGIHDFTTFTAAGDASESKVRQILSASFYYEQDALVFRIEGNAFLWKMVRSLLGTMIALWRESASPEEMSRLLQSGDRSLAGTTAPPQGLFLYRIRYE